MATDDYYNPSSTGRSGRSHDYNAPLPPLPSSSPFYSTQMPTHIATSIAPVSSPFENPAYPPYAQRSQTSFGSDSAYHGAGQGGRAQDSGPYADDIPLRPHPQKTSSEEWTAQNQQRYGSDDTQGLSELGKGGKGTRGRKKRRNGFFSGKIPWVVYVLTLVQTSVFIAELVRNAILTKTPIEIHPQFNPMIGPSNYVLINMGARFVPCMRNTPGVQDSEIHIQWPCPNSTSLDANNPSQQCQLSDLCGFSRVHDPRVKGSLNDKPEPNQWFRFILPIFLHAGIIHIAFNMLLQLTLGREMEIAIGSLRFALVYFSSGIFGFVLGGNFAASGIASTGASGSLFGVLALTLLDLLYTWKERRSPWKDLAFIGLDVVISFVLGLLPGLDNFSHIGGFLMGLVLGICILHSPNALRQRIGEAEPPYAPVGTARKFGDDVGGGVQGFVKRPVGFFKGRKPLWWAWWLLRAGALIGVLIGFIVLLNNFYTYHNTCSWCKYLSCLVSLLLLNMQAFFANTLDSLSTTGAILETCTSRTQRDRTSGICLALWPLLHFRPSSNHVPPEDPTSQTTSSIKQEPMLDFLSSVTAKHITGEFWDVVGSFLSLNFTQMDLAKQSNMY
ncbi:MAG: hypothetical protein M1830_010766 [Pleopsidium flavum]|nr:MAG: hypothetical protein M1830_010766 [Pleopsidium flavum]